MDEKTGLNANTGGETGCIETDNGYAPREGYRDIDGWPGADGFGLI